MKVIKNKILIFLILLIFFITSVFSLSPDDDTLFVLPLQSDALDISGKTNDFTEYGSPVYSSNGCPPSPLYSSCLQFDDTNDYLTKSGFNYEQESMTWGGWYCFDVSGGSMQTINKENTGSPYGGRSTLWLDFGSYNKVRVQPTDSNTAVDLPDFTPKSDRCMWLGMAYNGTSGALNMYLNGTLNKTSVSGSGTNSRDWFIGRSSQSAGNWFNGTMSEQFLWNRTLSSSEMLDIFTNGISITATPTIVTNQTNGTYYNYNPSINLNTSSSANYSVSLNGGSESYISNNSVSFAYTPSMSEGQNDFIFISRVGTEESINTSLTLFYDTTTPVINYTNNTEVAIYNINWSSLITCSDTNLNYCNITTDEGKTISYTNQSYTFSTNGNHSFNITAVDLAGNTATSNNNILFIDPEFVIYFNNNTANVNNFGINGTNYTNYFNGSIYDYGLGNHSFQFIKTGYEELDFNIDFTNSSDINTTIYLNPVYITIEIRNVDNGSLATANNYTILINNLDETTSAIYNVVNNNTYVITNIYSVNTSLSVSLVTNDSVVNTLVVVNPRVDYNISLYLTEQTEESRVFEVLDSSLSVVPNSYVYLYVYVPTTNEFVLQSQKETSILGLVTFDIVPLTKIYSVCNTYEGAEACLQQITFENVDTDPNQIIHATDLEGNTKNFLQFISWSKDEVKTNTSSQMTFTFADSQSLVTQFCFNVTRYTNTSASGLGDYCNANPSGQVVQTFSLGNDQRLEYTFTYTYEGNVTIIDKFTSYYFNPSIEDLKEQGIFDLIFLIVVFGGIGVLLNFKNFEIYNGGFLLGLLIIFIIQSVLNENYINIGIWGVLFIKTATYYAVRVESS